MTKKKAKTDIAVDPAFVPVIEAFKGAPGVALVKKFSASNLRVGGKVFAMCMQGALVVKLPKDRVESLSASGKGSPFRLGTKVMKEWASIPPGKTPWLPLVREAHAFVRGLVGSHQGQ